MTTTQKVEEFELVIEKIVFDEEELAELKIAIRNFSKGTITPKQLKQNVLQNRGRIVKDISNFLTYCLNRARENDQAPVYRKLTDSNQSDLKHDQLRQIIAERNELLEVVAKRISALALKKKKELLVGTKSFYSEEAIKNEIEHVFSAIKVNKWLNMCGYDDYQFFVKLYPKLEELYNERFGDSEKLNDNNKNVKVIMANKMAKLEFPEGIKAFILQYITVRNIFQHSMKDISQSDLEQAQETFVKVFVYLIISGLDSKLVADNREAFYLSLEDFFSKRLVNNPIFHKKMLERLKTVFNA